MKRIEVWVSCQACHPEPWLEGVLMVGTWMSAANDTAEKACARYKCGWCRGPLTLAQKPEVAGCLGPVTGVSSKESGGRA